MYIVDNTTDSNHYSVIENLASSADEMTIVSPFCFSDFSDFFGKLANCASIKKITFMTTLKRIEVATKVDSLLSFKQMAIQHNIPNNILINNSLHGKIYIFKSNGTPTYAIITSANATHNGFKCNHEWGCCFDDKDQIENLEKAIMSTAEYHLTDDIFDKIKQRVDAHKQEHPTIKQTPSPTVNISDIIVSHRFNIAVDPQTRIFLKPIGSMGAEVYDGDYSNETEQYFSKRRPRAVRKNDILISYAVGARKIVSIFRVLSDIPLNTGDEDSRWPWYVEVENMTPKLGKVWHERNDLYIMGLKQGYIAEYNLNITQNGTQSLGALQWGADKIQLTYDFGVYLTSLVMTVEDKL